MNLNPLNTVPVLELKRRREEKDDETRRRRRGEERRGERGKWIDNSSEGYPNSRIVISDSDPTLRIIHSHRRDRVALRDGRK